MKQIIKLSEIPDFSDQDVVVEAWILNIRQQGKKLAFLSLYDGTGEIQATLKKNNLPEDFDKIEQVYQGASIRLGGTVKEDHRAPTGFELQVTEFKIIHPSDEGYDSEVSPDSSLDVKLSKRHIVLRGPKSSSVLRLSSHVVKYIRDFFYSRGAEEVFPPLITETQAEGGSELFEVDYFKTPAYLSQSSQLYLEAAIYSLRDVFCILPSFRAEKSRTPRHLAEYRHIEGEYAFMEFNELKDYLEDMIIYVLEQVVENDQEILNLWDVKVEIPEKPFPRISYAEAIMILKDEYGITIPFGEDISDAPEKQLVDHFGKPIILEHFPTHMKPFYHKINSENEEITNSADFLFPVCGELIGCGERETDIESMTERMEKMDPPVDVEDYKWYLDLRKYGSVPHSGFGMGLERLIHWILKLDSVKDATLFPRTVNRINP